MTSTEVNDEPELETFCDGVFAIAITLLILDLRVPPLVSVPSVEQGFGIEWQAVENQGVYRRLD